MLTHSLCTVPVSIVVLVRQQNEHILTLTVQALSNNNMREATELMAAFRALKTTSSPAEFAASILVITPAKA